MSIAGTRFATCQITVLLGARGMGEVQIDYGFAAPRFFREHDRLLDHCAATRDLRGLSAGCVSHGSPIVE